MTKNKRNNGNSVRIPELLAPAGNLEKLKTAIHYGADAVYLGGKQYSLRAKAGNFSLEEIAEGVEYAHKREKRVYITVNIFAHNTEFKSLADYLTSLNSLGVDGLIISDPGVLQIAKQIVPNLPIHLSTQANVTNYESAKFWAAQSVGRINLARELSLEEIQTIRHNVACELEIFIHGALCISYSGRCMLSNYLTDRDANLGSCSHPCRFNYSVMEEKRPGEYFPVEEDDHGTYIFNSKDLCLLQMLPQLVSLGVDSLKIEGRMKSIFYVGGVTRIYRFALDYLQEVPDEMWQEPSAITLPENLFEEIEKTGTRGMTDNFATGKPTGKDMLYKTSRAAQLVEPVAVLKKKEKIPAVEIRNRVAVGETVELMGREMRSEEIVITSMENESGEALYHANPGNVVFLKTDPPLELYEEGDMLRRHIRVSG